MLNLETLTQEHNLHKAWPNGAADSTLRLAKEDILSIYSEG